jgi:hypothetical protein
LHRRYLDKLNKQEDEVEKYRADIKKLQQQEHSRRKALDDFLAAFSADRAAQFERLEPFRGGPTPGRGARASPARGPVVKWPP